MKKAIILFTILTSINCNAQSLFNIFTNSSVYNTGLSSFFGYDDLYFYENSKGEKKYLNRKSGGICFEPERYFIDRCEITLSKWEFFLNDLNTLDDRIEIYSNNFELNLNSNYKDFDFGVSAQYIKSELNYNIDEFIGEIPISYFQRKADIKYKNLKLSYNSISGKESECPYNNEVNGFSTGLSFDQSYKKVIFSTQCNYTNFSVDLQKDNSSFCELNGIQILQYSYSGKYNLHNYNSISTGITGITFWQRERSIFNAEPFINYYSLFFGSKTFIKKLNFNAIIPFIYYDQQFSYHILNFTASLEYYHLFTNSDIIYTERKWLIPGIWPDDSTQHKLDIIPDIDGILRIHIQGNVTYRNFIFGIIVNQLLPIDYSIVTKPQEPTPGKIKTDEHGGTSVILTIGYMF